MHIPWTGIVSVKQYLKEEHVRIVPTKETVKSLIFIGADEKIHLYGIEDQFVYQLMWHEVIKFSKENHQAVTFDSARHLPAAEKKTNFLKRFLSSGSSR